MARIAPSLVLVGGAVASTNQGASAATHHLPPIKPFIMRPFDATPVTAPAFAAPSIPSHDHSWARIRPATMLSPGFLADLTPTATTIPLRALMAYVNATNLVDKQEPACRLKWQTLAGIGYIESGHARSGGSGNPGWDGEANPPIYGPPLDGSLPHEAKIPNTEPSIDGPGPWARAVGPMQFLPSTWDRVASDGNHDGVADPQNIDDATLAAAYYLCATGSELNQPRSEIRAIYSYNHSSTYVRDVLEVAAGYMGIDPNKLGVQTLAVGSKGKRSGHLNLVAVGVPTASRRLRPHHDAPGFRHPSSPPPTNPPSPSTSPTQSPATSASPAATAAS